MKLSKVIFAIMAILLISNFAELQLPPKKGIYCMAAINTNMEGANIPDKDRIVYDKVVYLTFDDGPSQNNTPEILRILNNYKVRGTFFVIGKKVRANPNIVKNLYNSGMCILPHSNTHDYKEVYKSTDNFFKDYYQCAEAISDITGGKVGDFVRMPGGSDNLVGDEKTLCEIKNKLKEKNINYIDWNISSGDASRYKVPSEEIKENIIREASGWNTIVILMHDAEAKTTTVEALPSIIEHFKNKGYAFKTLNEISSVEVNKMIKYRIINR